MTSFSAERTGLDVEGHLFGLLTSAKGLWESDKVFVVHIHEIANQGRKIRVSLAFEGDQVSIEIWDNDTSAGTLIGRAKE
jgi:hypothetical protein